MKGRDLMATTAQRAMAYLRAHGVPKTRNEIHAFCTAYVVSDLCRDLAQGTASIGPQEASDRLQVALQLTIGGAL